MVDPNSFTKAWNWWNFNGFDIFAAPRSNLFHRLFFVRNSSLGIDRIKGNSPDRKLPQAGARSAGRRRLLERAHGLMADRERQRASSCVDHRRDLGRGRDFWKMATRDARGLFGALAVDLFRGSGFSLVPVGPAAGQIGRAHV